MDEEIERLVISVRADTDGVGRDIDAIRAQMEGALGGGAERAGRSIEAALLRAVRNGKLGFDDLGRVAMAILSDIADAAIRTGIHSIGLGGGGGGGLLSLGTQLLGSALGLPGRATCGAVSPGRAYAVGERGPEIFVPTASGRVEPVTAGGRDVRVAITLNAPQGGEAQALARSGRQVARAVRAALEAAER